MADAPVTTPIVATITTAEALPKSPLASRTIHFNWISGLLVPAVLPFLPRRYQESIFIIPAVTAWFSIGNIILRFATKEGISFFWRKEAVLVALAKRSLFWRKGT